MGIFLSLTARGEQTNHLSVDELNQRGWEEMSSNRWNAAQATFATVIAMDPTNAYAYCELGRCQQILGHAAEAIKSFDRAIVLAPNYDRAYLRLGYCAYQQDSFQKSADALEKYVSLNSTNFRAYLRLGQSLSELKRVADAVYAYDKALQLQPEDFDANEERGLSLMEARRFQEATVNFEKANQLQPGQFEIRLPLFVCYLATEQIEKAFQIFPIVLGVVALPLTVSYFMGLLVLFRFSFQPQTSQFPGLVFTLSWLVFFFTGQVLFLLPIALLTQHLMANVIFSGALSAVPLILAGTLGFARQPWGEPFAWPLRLGSKRTIGTALSVWVVVALLNSGYSDLISRLTHEQITQNTIPIITEALKVHPIGTSVSVVVVLPLAEEILFRGLMFGVLQRRLRITTNIIVCSLIFAAVHLQLWGFLPLFGVGLLLGWCRWKTGSLGLSFLMHALNNGMALLFLKIT